VRSPHVLAVLAVMVAAYFVATEPFFRGTVLPIRDFGLSVLFGSLIVLVLTVRPVAAMFAWAPVSWLGYRSYSLFLIHQPTLWYTSEALQKFFGVPEGPGLLALLWTVGFGAVIGIGLVLFVTVERPCITWAKRVPSSRVAASAGPTPVGETLATDADGDAPERAQDGRPPSP
jgi:peptidoglycan/LPS O-acetylase OafA/YrhL